MSSFNPNTFSGGSTGSTTSYNAQAIDTIVAHDFLNLNGGILNGNLSTPSLSLYGFNPYIRFPDGTTMTTAPHQFDKISELLNVENTFSQNQTFQESIIMTDGSNSSSIFEQGPNLIISNMTGRTIQLKTNPNNSISISNNNITGINSLDTQDITINEIPLNTYVENNTPLRYIDISGNLSTILTSLQSNIQNQIDTITNVDTGALQSLETISHNIQNNTDNITSLQSGLNTANNNIQTNTNNITSNTSNIQTNTNNIISLQSGLNTSNNNITSNTNNITTNTQHITTNTNNIQTNTNNITSLQSGLNTANNNITSNTNNITTNTNNIQTNTNNITSLQTGLNTANNNITSNTNNITTNTNNIQTNTNNIQTNTNNIISLQSGLNTANNNITTNTHNIQTNTSNIQTNTNNIISLQSGLNTANNNIQTNTNNITTNTNNIQTNTNNINTLQIGLNTANSNIGDNLALIQGLSNKTACINQNAISYPMLQTTNKNFVGQVNFNQISNVVGRIFLELQIGTITVSGTDISTVESFTLNISRQIEIVTTLLNVYDKTLIYTVRDTSGNQVYQTANLTPTPQANSYYYLANSTIPLTNSTITFQATGISQYNIYAYTEYTQFYGPAKVPVNAPPTSINNRFNINATSGMTYAYNPMLKQNLCSNTAGITFTDDIICNRMRCDGMIYGVQYYTNGVSNQVITSQNLVIINITPNSNLTSSFIIPANTFPVGHYFEFKKIQNNTQITILFQNGSSYNINSLVSTQALNPYVMVSSQLYLKFVQLFPNEWFIMAYA
jgi:predicted  nucleic acid-binding Zn-ribbon protein